MPHPLDIKIQQGEHQQQDFKFRIDSSRKIAKSLVAFANTDGGRLLIGVKDNGRVAGVRTEEEYYMIEAAAQLYTKPEVKFEARLWDYAGKSVMEIMVEPSVQRPHFAQTDDDRWLAYVRKDDQNLLANRILRQVWTQKMKLKGSKVTFSNVEEELFRYLREHGSISLNRFCKLCKIHRSRAERLLVKLICWQVIKMDITEKGTLYQLNPKSPELPES